MEYYPCGTVVTLITSGLKGMITAQVNRFGYREYEITYFSDGVRNVAMMNENEFSTDSTVKKIGF